MHVNREIYLNDNQTNIAIFDVTETLISRLAYLIFSIVNFR